MKRELTRNQAQKKIAASFDPLYIGSFAKHPNSHVQHQVTHKLSLLQARAESKAKRSEAARKANRAATAEA